MGLKRRRSRFNYLYFFFLFALLATLDLFHVYLIDSSFSRKTLFFLGSAIGQSFLECICLALIAFCIKPHIPKFLYRIYIALTFLLLICHIADFILVRAMDLSIWYALEMMFHESLHNFIEMLRLTGIPFTLWIALVPCIFAILGFSILLYNITMKGSEKWPLTFSRANCSVLLFTPLMLLLFELGFSSKVNHNDYASFQKVLPMKNTFLGNKGEFIHVSNSLKKPSRNSEVPIQKSIGKTPNVYLFIIESLREDFLTHETAPNIVEFRKKYFSSALSLASSNATQISWFSILFGKYPFYWAAFNRRENKEGSYALKILHEIGYKIHVYSGSELGYYSSDTLLFGQDHYLADSYHHFPADKARAAWEHDQSAIDQFEEYLTKQESREGNVFIFFLDSTHFNYSWPEEEESKFTPFGDENSHIKISHTSENLEQIKNRYRNSILFVDSLIGRVFNKLKEHAIWKESFIALTGDHGEEFLEEGHLFHASHLSKMQTEVPLYLKLNTEEALLPPRIASHIDIFPTLFDAMGIVVSEEIFDGESLLQRRTWPYAITCRYNGSWDPYEFLLHNGKLKVLARIHPKRNIFEAKKLEILSIEERGKEMQDLKEKDVLEKKKMKCRIKDALHRLF